MKERHTTSAHKHALYYFWMTQPAKMASIIQSGSRIELHHADITLKKRDPERYAQWNPADLIPLSQKDHLKLHMSHPHTKAHNKHISQGLKAYYESGRRFQPVRATHLKTGISAEYPNAAEAAKAIGCTRQHASQVLSGKSHYKTACGYLLQHVSKEEICPSSKAKKASRMNLDASSSKLSTKAKKGHHQK